MAKRKRTSTPAKAETTSKKPRRSPRLAKAAEVEHAPEEAIDTQEVQLPQYKDDSNAFNTPVEDGKDYISSIPSEMLDRILSYCVLDHDPEFGARQLQEGHLFKAKPHVFLSLAAMSKHLRAHVESFSLRELTKHKDSYCKYFRTNAELESAQKERRRSPRLKLKPAEDARCYREEFLWHLRISCIKCNKPCGQFAVMANSVRCCWTCHQDALGATINLTDSLKTYGLQDWMLLESRNPRLRAKQRNLPVIPYGTLRVSKPYMSGWMVSYRFFLKDVKAIAELVHGDVEAHMAAKRKKQVERQHKRSRDVHRKLKIRYHTDLYGEAKAKVKQLHHQKRIEHYESPDYDSDTDSVADESGYGYGNYGDEHEQFCFDKRHCDFCHEKLFAKYCPWW